VSRSSRGLPAEVPPDARRRPELAVVVIALPIVVGPSCCHARCEHARGYGRPPA
jgi:hypothetical protein